MYPSGIGLVSEAVKRDGVSSVRSSISSVKMSKIRGSFAGLRGRILSRALVAVSVAMANVEGSDRVDALPGRFIRWREGRHVLTPPGRDGHFEAVERHGVQLGTEDPQPRRIARELANGHEGRQIRPLAMPEGEPAA